MVANQDSSEPTYEETNFDSAGNRTKSSAATSAANDEPPPIPPKRDYAIETEVQYARVDRNLKRKKTTSFPPRPEFVYKPESTKDWMSCLSCSLIIFNLFIWLMGAALTALGIWIQVDKDFWLIQVNLDVTQFNTVSYILIAVGIVIMIIGVIGCWGAIAAQLCMLIIFAIVVVIVILLEIGVIVIVWSTVSNGEFQEHMKLQVTKVVQQMPESEAKTKTMNLMQHDLQCCGVNGPSDYSGKPPGSCYDLDAVLYKQGCFDASVEWLKSKADVLGGVTVVVFVMQAAALVLTCCLVCSIRSSSSNSIF